MTVTRRASRLAGLALAGLFSLPLTAAAAWSSVPAHSPTPTLWYVHQNAAFLNLDRPTPGSSGTTRDYFAGWAWNCNGQPPTIVVFRYDVTTRQYVPQKDAVVITGLYRPDVTAAYTGLPCNVTPFSGFQVYFPSGLPTGPHAYVVEAYSPGGTWNPYTGAIVPASADQQFFVVIQ